MISARRAAAQAVLAVMAVACDPSVAHPARPAAQPDAARAATANEPGARRVSEPPRSAPSSRTGDAPPTASASHPALPEGVEPGVLSQVAVPGDRPLYVVHGVASTRRALVYLHGVCGDVTAVRSWTLPVSRHGTLIALLGDKRCDVPNRYRWDDSTAELDARIDRAVGVVAQARNGLLDSSELAVLGYSQGATRAAVLVRQFPEKYRWVLLAGVPVEPRLDHVGSARSVAVVGGQRDGTTHMRRGVDRLVAAGKRAEFFELPDAGHGEYGPDGARVMGEALAFLFRATE